MHILSDSHTHADPFFSFINSFHVHTAATDAQWTMGSPSMGTNGMTMHTLDTMAHNDTKRDDAVGRVKVLLESPPMSQLEKELPDILPGGHFRPPDCRSRHRVAIIVPYRDREEHLRAFLHNVHPILSRQQIDYAIFVIEEVQSQLFNRAKLMNIGFVEAVKSYDFQCFIFHDVDLLPEDDRNL